MKKLYAWFTNHFAFAATLFFLAFIPLYPKLPIVNVIRTWVYIRLEDFLIAAAAGIFILLQIKRRKMVRSVLTWPILVYWGVGVVSAAWSISFIGPHLANYFPHLVAFHFARRVEYMLFFFVAFTAFDRNPSRLRWVIWLLAATVLGIAVYGVGQKFLGFPAFLTMNEEFAKGVPLRLPPTARIASTFGGHYDLAAYLVLVIPILASLVFGLKRWWEKGVFFFLWVASFILLLFTASRVSFGVYLVAINAMLIWHKKFLFIVPVVIGSFLLLNSVSGASERFYKTFRYSDVIVDLSTGRAVGTLDKLEGGRALVQESESPAVENLPKGSEFINVPSSNRAGSKQVKTIEYFNTKALATGSGEIATISGSFLIQKALVYDISLTTRFQGQWPKALEAFNRNVLLGSGYSTLSVASDGDYLRMLGETGLLGFVAFIGILIAAFAAFVKRYKTLEPTARAFVIGVFAGIVGLLCNAVLIDVFEASKVAYSMWLLLGIAVGLLNIDATKLGDYLKLLRRVLTHNIVIILYLVVLVLAFFAFTYRWYFIGDDFTWLRWATESGFGSVSRYFTEAAGFFYRPIPKVWYFLLYTVFWLKPGPYHFVSVALYGAITVCIYLILRQQAVRLWLAVALSVLFAVLSVHHENVFWISGQSSMLAAFFLFAGVLFMMRLWNGSTRFAWLWMTLTYLSVFASMLSYDGMLVAPLIIFVLGAMRFGRWKALDVAILLLVPLYWWMRSQANAVLPSGDYAYNPKHLMVNVIGNAAGYIAAIFAGPRAIEYFETLRAAAKTYQSWLVGFGGGALVAAAGLAWWLRRKIVKQLAVLAWVAAGALSLAAYVGLGGMAERYAFIASGFLLVGIGVFVEQLCQAPHGRRWLIAASIVVLGAIGYWNVREIHRIKTDWDVASTISEQTVLLLRQQLFPLDAEKTLLFVDTPIRYGRAWVFPMGLYDPLWHMFHLNPYAFHVVNVAAKEDAFTYPVGRTVRETFIFENYTLRRLELLIKEVDADEIGNEK